MCRVKHFLSPSYCMCICVLTNQNMQRAVLKSTQSSRWSSVCCDVNVNVMTGRSGLYKRAKQTDRLTQHMCTQKCV